MKEDARERETRMLCHDHDIRNAYEKLSKSICQATVMLAMRPLAVAINKENLEVFGLFLCVSERK